MFYEIIGWIGMILVLIDYILLSLDKIKNKKLYQATNFFTAVFMAIGKSMFFFYTASYLDFNSYYIDYLSKN